MSQITPRLADAKRALDAADRARSDGEDMVHAGRALAKQGAERIRAADQKYWTAARLVFEELTKTSLTQQQVAIVLGRSRSYVSKLYSVGKTFKGRDPQAERLTFDAAYRAAQEVSDYGIGREKVAAVLGSAPLSLTQSGLAGQTGLAQSTVSDYLSQMIAEGLVQKGPGRPARYELAPSRLSDVRPEHPIEDGHPEPPGNAAGGSDNRGSDSRDAEGEVTDRLARGEPVPGGPGACGREGCAHAKVHHNQRNRTRECGQCACPGWIPGAQPGDEGGRQRSDVREMLAFLDRRVHREIASRRVVPTPGEARMLVEEMAGAIAALRDQATITTVPPDQAPDQEGVGDALAALGRQLRWASVSGQRAWFTDGATVWVVIASTRAAIIRDTGKKITACPSDVTAGWLLGKATKG